jgi:hypothetical protein
VKIEDLDTAKKNKCVAILAQEIQIKTEQIDVLCEQNGDDVMMEMEVSVMDKANFDRLEQSYHIYKKKFIEAIQSEGTMNLRQSKAFCNFF